MNAKTGIGLALIVAFMALGAYSFFSSQVSSVTIANAKRANHTVQVTGAVDFETMNYDVTKQRLEFDLVDAEADDYSTSERLHVVFYGEVPGNFEQALSVTVVGKSGEDGFVAENMLVKCPSKYQGEDGQEYEEEGDGIHEYKSQAT